MSSEEFEKLHEMYRSLFEEIKLMPERLLRSHAEEKKRLMRTFDERKGEAEEILQGMEEELHDAPPSYRNPMRTKLRLYQRDLAKLQRDMKNSAAGSQTSDGTHGGIYSSQNRQSTRMQSQRALLLQGTESLHNASQSIERSQRLAAETEHIGSDIIEELGEQREQLDRTRNRLENTGENLSRSRKILRSMSRRLMTNKLLLGVIILMELAILGAVVYLKFFRR
ncbi:vesicle transport through interaction with t-SNAREs homolog 1B [Dunckerocampus dactyliophorus]|uniref:vesicle transport through interaction with t-SNAREs homolog 1B n=1 Tax=Dunckerocampus dactyliophorus TaxID=161453 RepID=UPI002405BA9F|nr:vesicle transport through interaction with t-SNAREs homolog 1B [Dunckerocampus dactyliophorus]XP_054652994.1 vesicle transport through interaction with t-SNAREs homolog 1B [Dunckerocampus dactyliophorus]